MSWLARMEMGMEVALNEGIRDSYSWHRKLWDCFPGSPEASRDFLTRVDILEGAFRVWLLARTRPVRPGWCPERGFSLKEIAPSFLSHRYYAFDVRANPVRTVARRGPDGEDLLRANGKRKGGKRVPLVRQEDLREWIVRKGRARCRDKDTGLDVPGGFRILEEEPLEISPMVESHFSRKGKPAYHGGVQFRGVLEVTDPERFADTYHAGIGSAKSFGFGLLLLAPVDMDR